MRPLRFFLHFSSRPLRHRSGHFCSPFESDFVVGYAQSGLRFGATMVTPQFIPVAGGKMSLDSLVAIGETAVDNVNIRVLDSAGRTVEGCDYTWNDYMYDDPCWVNADFEKVEDISFAAGQGLWVYGSSADEGLQSAGQVGTNDVTVTLRFGATPTGNPFPVSIDLQDIIATGDTAVDNVNIRVLDSAGRTVEGSDYTWNDYMYDDPCWVNADFEKVEGVSFAPGQGLWVYGSSDSEGLCFPAPEL